MLRRGPRRAAALGAALLGSLLLAAAWGAEGECPSRGGPSRLCRGRQRPVSAGRAEPVGRAGGALGSGAGRRRLLPAPLRSGPLGAAAPAWLGRVSPQSASAATARPTAAAGEWPPAAPRASTGWRCGAAPAPRYRQVGPAVGAGGVRAVGGRWAVSGERAAGGHRQRGADGPAALLQSPRTTTAAGTRTATPRPGATFEAPPGIPSGDAATSPRAQVGAAPARPPSPACPGRCSSLLCPADGVWLCRQGGVPSAHKQPRAVAASLPSPGHGAFPALPPSPALRGHICLPAAPCSAPRALPLVPEKGCAEPCGPPRPPFHQHYRALRLCCRRLRSGHLGTAEMLLQHHCGARSCCLNKLSECLGVFGNRWGGRTWRK